MPLSAASPVPAFPAFPDVSPEAVAAIAASTVALRDAAADLAREALDLRALGATVALTQRTALAEDVDRQIAGFTRMVLRDVLEVALAADRALRCAERARRAPASTAAPEYYHDPEGLTQIRCAAIRAHGEASIAWCRVADVVEIIRDVAATLRSAGGAS